jgi:hypothetical protein
MPCYQCGRQPMYEMVIQGHKVHLCIDCQLKMEQIRARQNEESERMINFLQDQMASMAGMPPMGPRFPERKIIHTEGAILNNINIHDSQIGVVNTGYVQTIDAAVTTIREHGNGPLSEALSSLTEAVVAESQLDEEHRKEVLELISTISAEASLPEAKRRKSIIRPLVAEIGQMLQGTAAAVAIYDRVLPLLRSLF